MSPSYRCRKWITPPHICALVWLSSQTAFGLTEVTARTPVFTRVSISPPGYVGTATVRGCRRPMVSTQIVPIVATNAIGMIASGKLPVSSLIHPIM
jgi:hypothetical protein